MDELQEHWATMPVELKIKCTSASQRLQMLRLADPTKLSMEDFETKVTMLMDCVLPLPTACGDWTGERPFASAILNEITLEFEDVSSQDAGKKSQQEIDSEIASLNGLVKEGRFVVCSSCSVVAVVVAICYPIYPDIKNGQGR